MLPEIGPVKLLKFVVGSGVAVGNGVLVAVGNGVLVAVGNGVLVAVGNGVYFWKDLYILYC